MKTMYTTAIALTVGLTTAAQARNHTAGPPKTPAQHHVTLQGDATSKAAAAKSAHEAAAAYNRAFRAAQVGDAVLRHAAKKVPYGGAAYGAGKALGTAIMTMPVSIQKVPPLPHYGYQAPSLPAPILKALPSLPAGGHY